MFQKVTALRKMQRVLSGKGRKLFDNQVCFYNGIFGMTNSELFSEELVEYMEAAEHDECSEGIREGARNRKKQEIDDFLRGGLDSSSSNVGKHINDEIGMAIPKFHCIHYAQAEQKKEICRRLAAVIRYCSHGATGIDLQEVMQCLKKDLSYASGILSQAETADHMLLATIFYEIIQTHLSERHNPELQKHEAVFGKVNMKQQIEEYFLTCDCYEATSIDFFFALQRMADKNVIASSNLAGFYYVGMEFVVKNEGSGPHGTYVVEKNLEQAACYFKQSTTSEPPYAPAAYSYGYMILHKEAGDMAEEERMKIAEHYYQMGAAQKFHHAVAGLGDLALMRAEKLFKEMEKKRKVRTEVDIADFETQIVKELAAAIGYFDQAEKMGSFWGPIKAAQFLDNPTYAPYFSQVLTLAGLTGEQRARLRWKNAVAMGNVFAMDQLALLDLKLAYKQSAAELRQEYVQEAEAMLNQAAQMNYPNASYHLAQYLFSEAGFTPNKKKYLLLLEKSAHDGSARASILLGKMALERCEHAKAKEEKAKLQKQAASWFQRAEEQNFRCFEKEVYEELRKYK